MLKFKRIISVLVTAAMLTVSWSINTGAASTSARYMEALDRGLVAMMTDNGVYLTWRLLGTEAYNTTFDVYRDGTKINTAAISDSTDYLDADGTSTSAYKVVSSNETASAVTKTAVPFSSGTNYLEIPVAPIDDYVHDGTSYEYKIHDASVGDVDGDGEYEIVVKREANHQHAGFAGFNHMYLEAYKLDGTVLWRIDMGQNIDIS